MSNERTASLRRRPSSPAAPPLEDDDLLVEILLRLPPLPSSLPRASAVSRRWRSLASDPRFCRRFRAHHRRNPPLLGCFVKAMSKNYFLPAMEAPNRIPEGHFPFPIPAVDCFETLGCRHGLVLIFHTTRNQLLVFDPVTGDQHRLDIPPVFLLQLYYPISGVVLRAAGDVHHFQVVLVGHCAKQKTRLIASVYSSETGAWGNLISTQVPSDDSNARVYWDTSAVMVGDSFYWLVAGDSFVLLEFDLGRQSLGLIPMPGEDTLAMNFRSIRVIPTEGGGLGFLFLSGGAIARLWKRKADCDGVVSWVLTRTVALNKLLSIDPNEGELDIIGFAEENNVVLLWSSIAIFTIQLESLQFKKLPGSFYPLRVHPFEGVYTADKGIDGGDDTAELLQNI